MARSLFMLYLLKLFSILLTCNALQALPKFSSILIFGDSLVDTGNNNFISTIVTANHAPYGVSFPGGIPTGRFSDGKLMSDFLADALGLKQVVPPFLDPNLPPSELSTGVCFASAGAGYDEITGATHVIIPVTKQYQSYFKDYKHKLVAMVGEKEASNILKNSLVFSTSGSNDVFEFYENPLRYKSLDQYQDVLIGKIVKFIQSLYKDGCRNMAIAGIPLICAPRGLGAQARCLNNENSDSNVYNRKLQAMLTQLQPSLPGSKLVYADISKPLTKLAANLSAHGLYPPTIDCCGRGIPTLGPTCNISVQTCPNPENYFLWDAVHPTQAVYHYMSHYLIKNVLPKFNKAA
ncbi:GDSL esterase/lipase [Heracleum sosnowskyi]|uniref:GDSL esterase/lipase n=1 Tax=Heracleum sosnowskyi TaxID=360622 RepID=A0AAD8MKS3_9APIA|nr:GDSL esterase/lipase [Heracleum sosnowskyi]